MRGRDEARELVGVSSGSPFAQKSDFDRAFGEPCWEQPALLAGTGRRCGERPPFPCRHRSAGCP